MRFRQVERIRGLGVILYMWRAKKGSQRRINLRVGPLPVGGVLLSVFVGMYGGINSFQASGQSLAPGLRSDSGGKNANVLLNLPASEDRASGQETAAAAGSAADSDSGAISPRS